jgi:uncharacterized tellurite resistance protein B-like protein
MFPLMTELPLTPAQVIAATRLMLHVAHVDGAGTDEEVALISQFYDACRPASADFPAFETLDSGWGAADVSRADFPDARHRDMLVALCVMVAYADGELSTPERAAVARATASLGLANDRLEQILAQVKDHMLAQLSRLPDAASVAVVAKELG